LNDDFQHQDRNFRLVTGALTSQMVKNGLP
jgi:hypothetical protein